jgi:peptidoglycan/LPS O-acetylase OafA/YrhL
VAPSHRKIRAGRVVLAVSGIGIAPSTLPAVGDVPGAAPELPSLTPLRGIAALIVLLYHANVLWNRDVEPLSGAVCLVGARGIERGYLAVDFFFVLSGFILLHVYGRQFSQGAHWDARSFFRARIARIFPVHLVTTALFVPFYLTDSSYYSATGLVATVLLVQPWFWSHSWNSAAWSISGEWHAYLLFPFLARHIMRNSSAAALTLGICSGLVVASLAAFVGCGHIARSPLLLVRAIPEFIMGAATYRLFLTGAVPRVLSTDTFVLAIGAVLILISETELNDLFVILLLPAFLLACAHNTGAVYRALNSFTCVYLGRISYSLYLGQGVVMSALLTLKPALSTASPVNFAAAFVVLSMAFAAALSRWIEYPARDLLRRALGSTPGVHRSQ